MPILLTQGLAKIATRYCGINGKTDWQSTINHVVEGDFVHRQGTADAQKRANLGNAQFIHLIFERSPAGLEHLGGPGLHAVGPSEGLGDYFAEELTLGLFKR